MTQRVDQTFVSQYAPVGNISMLELLELHDLLGNYLLLLAHDVLAHEYAYRQLMERLRFEYGKDLFIIMDNGTIELGHPVPTPDIIKAAMYVDANCIVLPDVIGDLEATQALVEENAYELHRHGFPLMKLPQGRTFDELKECVGWMIHNVDCYRQPDEPNYWAIPRWIANEFGSRLDIYDHIVEVVDNPKIHLLGMSRNFEDDLTTALHNKVMGIDSANPVVCGMRGINIAHQPLTRRRLPHEPREWMDIVWGKINYMGYDWLGPGPMTDVMIENIRSNIDYIRVTIVGGEHV